MYWIGLGTEIVGLNSPVVPISQVVLKTGFTVYKFSTFSTFDSFADFVSFLYDINLMRENMSNDLLSETPKQTEPPKFGFFVKLTYK